MQWLRAWKSRPAIALVVVGSTLSTGAVGGSLLGSANRADALHHLELVEGFGLAEAVPGQFYAITEEGDIREPLCGLHPDDFEPTTEGYHLIVTNLLGDALPSVLQIWNKLVPFVSLEPGDILTKHRLEMGPFEENSVPSSRLLHHNQRILGELRDRDAIRKEATDEIEMRRALRSKDCGDAVRHFVKDTRLHVCQLRRVVEVQNQLFGVNFSSLCLTPMGGEPVHLPKLKAAPIWARAKSGLGLIDFAKMSGEEAVSRL